MFALKPVRCDLAVCTFVFAPSWEMFQTRGYLQFYFEPDNMKIFIAQEL